MNGRTTSLTHRIRIAIIFGLFFCFLGLVELRLYTLQYLSYDKFRKTADSIHYKTVSYEPQRGWIYDRNGSPLATSVEFSALIASPKDIILQKNLALKDKKSVKKNLDIKLANDLAPLLGESSKTIFSKLTQDTTRAWLVLSKEISVENTQKIAEIQSKYRLRNELTLEPVAKRVYPKGELACHVLGPVGLGHPDLMASGWGAHRALGGLEMVRQNQVNGNYGFTSTLQDRNGNLLSPIDDNLFLSISGDQLYVTLDETLQSVAETELAQTVDKYKAKNGCVVVMDPNTGEILAMANYPNYNLENFNQIRKDQWKYVSVNRAVEAAFEPGSTFKIFTASAALEEGKVKLLDTFNGYNGKIKFAGRVLRDSHPYGLLTFPQIIELSSNIGIHQVAQRLSTETLYNYIRKFGFGRPTGIELPGETPGLVQPLSAWNQLVLSRISFGQSIAVSAIQLASAVSVIANGGLLLKPHIVKSVHDAQGKLIKEYQPEIVRRVISKGTANTMAEIMEGVVLRGTGKGAAIPNVRVAGKTGTAQVAIEGGRGYKSGKYLSSFIGFLPVESPKVVIGVFINEPSQGGYYGGTVATPAFRNIAEAALSQLRIHPKMPDSLPMAQNNQNPAANSTQYSDDYFKEIIPVAYDSSDPINVQEEQDVMPNLKGLTKRASMVFLSTKELNVTWKGSGVVIEQYPKAGSKITPGESCQIILGSNNKSTQVSSLPTTR